METISPEIQELVQTVRTSKRPVNALQELFAIQSQDSFRALYESLDAVIGTYWYWQIVQHLHEKNYLDPLPLFQEAFTTTLPDEKMQIQHRLGALHFLKDLPEAMVFPLIEAALKRNQNQSTILRVIDTLGNHDTPMSHYLLTQFTTHRHYAVVRLESINAMRKLKNIVFVNPLITVLENPHEKRYVKYCALRAIREITGDFFPQEFQTRLLPILRDYLFFDSGYLKHYTKHILKESSDSVACTLYYQWIEYQEEIENPDTIIIF